MSILVIGQSSFLAQEVQKLSVSKDWTFLGYKEAFDKSKWPDDVNVVIGFACDPKVKEGVFSDFDHKLAKMAKEFGAFYIMLSSRAVYGVADQPQIFKEDQKPYPDMTSYGQAKREIEDDLLKNFDNVIILRLSIIFGLEYNLQDPRQTFFGLMLKSLKEEGKINFSMSNQTYKDFLPVSVFGEHLAIIANKPKSGIYNFGSAIRTSVDDMAQWVIEGYGSGVIEPNQLAVIDNMVMDMTKTSAAYRLPSVTTEIIRQNCVAIGQCLKEIK